MIVSPADNPDLLTLIAQRRFVVDGEPVRTYREPVWNQYSFDVVRED